MSNIEQLDPLELLQYTKEAGWLDSNVTVNCVHCNALFPEEYGRCPQCKTNEI